MWGLMDLEKVKVKQEKVVASKGSALYVMLCFREILLFCDEHTH